MAVSSLGFKIIKNAIKIRLDRNEDTLENLVKVYDKLSDNQKKELLEFYKDYKPKGVE